jgi:SAM-dependent methyltransferase
VPERGAEDATAIPENVYGNRKRLAFILRHLRPGDRVLEVGCGTGVMLCRPLARLGYDVHGIDLDTASITFGQRALAEEGLEPGILAVSPLSAFSMAPDVVIASEVLEHLQDHELGPFLAEVRQRLKPQGRFLVTVPNGYGWFELEQLLWYTLRLGPLLYHGRICNLIESTKARLLGSAAVDPGKPSTLANSPHVQRFTLGAIRRLLVEGGFEIVEAGGSVAISGPFSNLFFAGIEPFLEANARWGDRLGWLASGFFLACRARQA